jgi:hypothetical protein
MMNMGRQNAGAAKFTEEHLRDLMSLNLPPERMPRKIRVITDTTDFFRVDYDDVVILDDRPYLIRHYEREGRFGIDDEPKFWVKRAIDLESRTLKVIKMVFDEKFMAKAGDLTFECVRSPRKEAKILDLVRGHRNFMQGFSAKDSAGNIIRVIDYIHGITMNDRVAASGMTHEEYFHARFPVVLDDFIELAGAIGFLHEHGEKHGDIRRDHIKWDEDGQSYRWIDFDFDYMHRENMFGYDLYGLGNILVFLVGQGDITTQELKREASSVFDRLTEEDLNIVFTNRVVNLRKIYPYIPEALNLILLHFSVGAELFYDDTVQLLEDLQAVRQSLV